MIYPDVSIRSFRGVSQEERLPAALRQGYILPWERSLAEELLAIARHAATKPMQSDGKSTWAELIERDPGHLHAIAVLLVLGQRFSDVMQQIGATDPAHQQVSEGQDVDAYFRFAESLLSRLEHDQGLQLSSQIASIRRDVLQSSVKSQPTDVGRSQRKSSLGAKLAALLPDLEKAFETRLSSGSIDPALALLLANLKVLHDTKQRLNDFPDRHVRFYYEDILGLSPKGANGGRVLLEITPSVAGIRLEAGTTLTATTGRNQATGFRLSEPVELTPGRIEKVYKLRYERPRKGSFLCCGNFVTGIRRASIDAEKREPTRLFSPAPNSPEPTLGLMVESQILNLAEGRREIRIRLEIAQRRTTFSNSEIQETWKFAKKLSKLKMIEFVNKKIDKVSLDQASLITKIPIISELYPNIKQNQLKKEIFDSISESLECIRHPETPKDFQFNINPFEIALLSLLKHANSEEQVRATFGIVMANIVLSSGEYLPSEEIKQEFRALATQLRYAERDPERREQMGNSQAAQAIADLIPEESDLSPEKEKRKFEELFYTLFSDAFEVQLTTENGMITARQIKIERNPEKAPPGLTLRVDLDSAVPAITPPRGAMAPGARITLAEGARFMPVSFFEAYDLSAVHISVEVVGLRKLSAFSDDGPLDLSQPILPFGAQPRNGASLFVGAPEIACKRVESIRVKYLLAELPRLPEGGEFDEYYAGYGAGFTPPDPTFGLSYLTSNGWQPLASDENSLLRDAEIVSETSRQQTLACTIRDPCPPPIAGTSRKAFLKRHDIRAGLLRFDLQCGVDGFGIDAYPLALARALRGSWLPLREQKTPNPPYIPKFSSLTVDYTASTRIMTNASYSAEPGDRIVQIGPFGTQEIFPKSSRPNAGVFGPRLADGVLYIGVSGTSGPTRISILFEMCDTDHERLPGSEPEIRWQFLGIGDWVKLEPWRILADSTESLSRSGVIVIDLPESAVPMPVIDDVDASGESPPYLWLAVTSQSRLDTFPTLTRVSLNGAIAKPDVLSNPRLVKNAVWALNPPIEGVAGVRASAPFGSHSIAESQAKFRARVAEGLRHRQRAVTPWDIERLTLEAFPDVWRAACFPLDYANGRIPNPGHATLVVLPYPPATATDEPAKSRTFSTATLRKIQEFVLKRSSRSLQLTVRNPSFEWLQIRAIITFNDAIDSGPLIRRLKLDVSRRLSVWTAPSPLDAPGWSIDLNEIGSFVEALSYVHAVRDLEILHLVHDQAETCFYDGDYFRLHDTVTPMGDGSAAKIVRGWEPWSVPLPMHDHLISVSRRSADPNPRTRTRLLEAGIGDLAVGETFIVRGETEEKV